MMLSDAQSPACRMVQAIFERLSALDVDGFLALFADDGRQVLPYAPAGFPNGFDGKVTLDAAYRQLFGNYQSVEFVGLIIEDMADPSRFLAAYETDIRFRDGRRYSNSYISTFAVGTGGIVEWVEYFDPVRLAAQLGDVFEPSAPS